MKRYRLLAVFLRASFCSGVNGPGKVPSIGAAAGGRVVTPMGAVVGAPDQDPRGLGRAARLRLHRLSPLQVHGAVRGRPLTRDPTPCRPSTGLRSENRPPRKPQEQRSHPTPGVGTPRKPRQSAVRRATVPSNQPSRGEQHVTESAVLPAKIEQLPDLAGYLKFASHPAWLRVRLHLN